MQEIVLQYTYLRLNAEVSKHRKHLLKATFCVHPKTGRICVPVDPSAIDSFRPERARAHKPSMKPYVEMLDRHVAALMEEVRRAKRELAQIERGEA
ncbi:uncharacterized protein B0H18DRAFT_1102183 [Fomitopsis serialis]|uniref:uncharacterized protein n=1 Tax=Fomitopsis serialis TaxID=139415 RepID=UPI002007B7F0|nr:uncharacterized protein B0H18DRAFT_1102183 [Neoantrodia serialis]KAH9932957.1 hypothetical protein B0H18DRAFT_1102183 [Neoantrodia serialis]